MASSPSVASRSQCFWPALGTGTWSRAGATAIFVPGEPQHPARACNWSAGAGAVPTSPAQHVQHPSTDLTLLIYKPHPPAFTATSGIPNSEGGTPFSVSLCRQKPFCPRSLLEHRIHPSAHPALCSQLLARPGRLGAPHLQHICRHRAKGLPPPARREAATKPTGEQGERRASVPPMRFWGCIWGMLSPAAP